MRITRILIVILLSYFYDCQAQSKATILSATIKHVSLYPTGAEMQHQVACTLPEGIHEILVSNVSNHIKSNSIQIIPLEFISILNILPVTESEIKLLPNLIKEKIESKESELEKIDIQIMALKGAQSLLDQNKQISGDNSNLSLIELIKIVDYYEKKTLEIQSKINALSKQKEVIQKEILKIDPQNEGSNQYIKIVLQCHKGINTQLQFSYFTDFASWSPHYDIKSKGIESPLKLIYNGIIYQNTGLDWKNVSLSLNTANPQISGGDLPILNPWFIKARQHNPISAGTITAGDFASLQGGVYQRKSASMNEQSSSNIREENKKVYSGSSESTFGLNTQFLIEKPYTILANPDGKSQVLIKEYELPARYKYYCIPKKDLDPFFVAEVSNWEDMNLIPGEASIYFDGNYTGLSTIDPSSTRDTLNVSLGRDRKIIVKREKLKDYCTQKMIGNKKLQTIAFEIRVRNGRKEPIDIIIDDQYPLSTDKEIEVEVEEFSGAIKDETSGTLTWKLKIAPNETKKLKVSYNIKYPKEQDLGPLF